MAMLVLSHSREVHIFCLHHVRRLTLMALAIAGTLAAANPKLTADPFAPNDPYFFTGTPEGFPGQWHLDKQSSGALIDANVRGAWERGLTGAGVVIGVLEGGFDYLHEDLAPNYAPELSWDFVDNDPDPRDTTDPIATETGFFAHATSVAGVAAARGGNGVGITGAAPYASLSSLVFEQGGFTPFSDAVAWQRLADAITFKSDDESEFIDIKNLSFGQTSGRYGGPLIFPQLTCIAQGSWESRCERLLG